jgi:hypothetical protein
MTVKGVTYSISAEWKNDMEHPAAIGARVIALLDRIEADIPVKTMWVLGDFADVDKHAGPDMAEPGIVPLTDARTDMTAFVERNDTKDEDGSTDPRNGFFIFARGTQDGSDLASSQSIDVTANVGSYWDNQILFEVGGVHQLPDPALTTYPIYRAALEAMASSFPCPYACAKYFIITETEWVPGSLGMLALPGERLEIFDGAWIAYLSAPFAAGFTPPPEIFAERTPGGGLILSAVKDHIDPTNPDHVRRSRVLQAILNQQLAGPNERGQIYPGDFPPRVGPY